MSIDLKDIAGYRGIIEKQIRDFCESSPNIISYADLLTQIYGLQNPIKIEGSPIFTTKVYKWLRQLSVHKLGRALISQIMASEKKLTIIEGKRCIQYDQTITIHTTRRYYYFSVNSEGEYILCKQPKSIILGHELIHHLRRNLKGAHQDISIAANIGPNFCNLEEQWTTCGLSQDGYGNYSIQTYSENSLLFSQRLPLRMNYSSLIIPKGQVPSLIDMVYAKAIGSIKAVLKKSKATINQKDQMKTLSLFSYRRTWAYLLEKKITPLSLAFYLEEQAIAKELLAFGADINALDDLGGPSTIAMTSTNNALKILCLQARIKHLFDRVIQQ